MNLRLENKFFIILEFSYHDFVAFSGKTRKRRPRKLRIKPEIVAIIFAVPGLFPMLIMKRVSHQS
jgi:hypothetical protein